jgi:hypothetical protein
METENFYIASIMNSDMLYSCIHIVLRNEITAHKNATTSTTTTTTITIILLIICMQTVPFAIYPCTFVSVLTILRRAQ